MPAAKAPLRSECDPQHVFSQGIAGRAAGGGCHGSRTPRCRDSELQQSAYNEWLLFGGRRDGMSSIEYRCTLATRVRATLLQSLVIVRARSLASERELTRRAPMHDACGDAPPSPRAQLDAGALLAKLLLASAAQWRLSIACPLSLRQQCAIRNK